jgi:DNA-binding MarR family transcriptional regulator
VSRARKRDRIGAILEQWARERPDIETLPMGVVGRIQRAAQALRPRLDATHASFGLLGESFDVLAALRRAGKPYRLTPTQLYEQLMLSSGAVTNRLERLAEAGLIERRPDPNDGRSSLVLLSPKGLKTIERAVGEHVRNEAALLGALSRAEQVQLSGLLERLLISWDDVDPA